MLMGKGLDLADPGFKPCLQRENGLNLTALGVPALRVPDLEQSLCHISGKGLKFIGKCVVGSWAGES